MEPIIEDIKKAVRTLVGKMYDPDYFKPDIIDPDPHAPFAWLAIDTKRKMAMVVYLKDQDAESVPFKGIRTNDYI